MNNIRFDKQDRVGYLTVTRPGALNALNQAALEELNALLAVLEKDTGLTCILVTGDGDKAFVAGADIAEMSGMSEAEALEFSRFGSRVFRRLECLTMPTIALVNGYALGGGCELALSCDIILATSSAVFALPETSLGVMCGFGGTQRLAKRIGPGNAKRMIFTADRVKAEEAWRMGLCDGIATPECLKAEGLALAGRIGRNAPYAVSLAKKAVDTGLSMGAQEGYEAESLLFSQCFAAGEANRILRAFLERKK